MATTRSRSSSSSSSAPPLPPIPSTSNLALPPHQPPLSPQSLLSHLSDLFPGRTDQIRHLLCLLGTPTDSLPPLLVYGGASTGKTSIITEIFHRLRRPFAYVSWRSCHNPRILFESVLNQLLGHTRTAANNYASAKKCDKLVDFVDYLPEACKQALSRDSKVSTIQSRKDSAAGASMEVCQFKNVATDCNTMSHGEDAGGQGNLQVVYLIFDNLEMLLSSSSSFRLISALLRLSEFTRLPNLGLIFISSRGPDAFFSGTGTLEPVTVYFRDYTDEELFQILVKAKPHSHLFSSFLSAVLKPFSRATRRVTELSQSLEPLFEKYLEPIRSGIVKPDEQGKRKLFSLLKPHITLALNQTFSFSEFPALSCSSGIAINKCERKGSLKKKMGAKVEELDFELSLCSKYLLVSAFICSRNPPTLDATLFDSSGGSGSKKRRRRASQVSLEKKELERQEKLLKGPGSFPLERVLAIFSCISAEMNEDLMTDTSCMQEDKGGMDVIADVLMQLSTLVNANLLTKGSSDPLEGGARYRCNADEELVRKIARTVKFPLSRYLYRA